MSLESYPNASLTTPNFQITRPWDTWFNRLRKLVNFGESPSADTEIKAANGIIISSDKMRIKGDGGSPVTITANPQISAGYDGQVITLEGLDNTSTVTMNNGNGVELKIASIVFDANTVYQFIYNQKLKTWIRIL